MLVLCFISFILPTLVSSTNLRNESSALQQNEEKEYKSAHYYTRTKTPWITHIITKALDGYIPSGETDNDSCTKQGLIYENHLSNLTLWATKMFDASSRGISSGIIEGRNFDYGHFDECVSVSSEKHGITGKYVMVAVEFAPYRSLYPEFYHIENVYKIPGPEKSAWDSIKPTSDKRISQRNLVNWAICVPAACTDANVQTSLAKRLYPALASHRIHGNVTVRSEYSYSRANDIPRTGLSFYTFTGITGVLLALVAISTYYDYNEDEKVKNSWYRMFSIRKNFNELFTVSDNEFSVISGMKVLSMCMIVFGHRMMFSISSPLFNPNNVQMIIGNYFTTITDNGTLVVNTFMTVTGFITFYKIIDDMEKKKPLQLCQKILKRFLRLTPAYLFVMGLYYCIFPYIEGGPLSRVIWDKGNFGKYWWTHLGYINNYIAPAFQCLVPAWYIAFDMQMYIFCCLMGAALQHVKKLILPILSIISVFFLLLPAIKISSTGFNGTYLIYHKTLMDYFRDPEFQYMYLPTHIRAAPYVIGMLGGYIYYEFKANKITMSRRTLWIGTLLGSVLMHGAQTLSWPFYIPGREYVLWENMAYAAFHRFAWSSTVCWIIIAANIGQFGPFKNTIGLKPFEPLNKLTYSVLLIHTIVQIYMIGYIRAPVNYDITMGIWMACGDCFFSYGAAIFIYCIVEAPFSNLQQRLLDNYLFKSHKNLKKS